MQAENGSPRDKHFIDGTHHALHQSYPVPFVLLARSTDRGGGQRVNNVMK